MSECKHVSLEYIGEQRTDEGVNTYFRCTKCGNLVVTTPERTVFAIKGVKPGMASANAEKKKGKD